MLSLSRGLTFGLLIAGLALFVSTPTELRAQAKKDAKKEPPPVKKEAPPAAKKDPKPDDSGERTVAFGTSDGLTLKGYWYQGIGLDKQRPDAVMMFPSPGTKVTDTWIELAKKLSEKNFSVLLFDWRGCGMNGPEAGARIFENADQFWREPYNKEVLAGRKSTIENKGLDYKDLRNASTSRYSYRDFFLMNDLMGARFFLDKMNDDKKCNTNRTWIVSEKDGVHLGVAFIATEFRRNSIYTPNVTPTIGVQQKPAGRDYAGVVALSYDGRSSTVANQAASKIYRNALPAGDGMSKEIRNHLETRLATVLIYSKKEGISASRGLVNQLGVAGDESRMKDNFKYMREIDVKDKAVTGISMIDGMDTFGVKATILEAMVGISKAQPFGRDATDREANKMLTIQRFNVDSFNRP